jgi:hypothetical protein
VLADVGTADYLYQLGFSSSASDCSMCGWINNRGENQVNDDLIALTTSGTGADGRMTTGDSVNVLLSDPVSGQPDPAVKTFVDRFGTDQYGSLTLASARLMRLILAEQALFDGGGVDGGAAFDTHINAIRAFDDKDPFAGEVSDLEILQNTLFMGLRLPDMFRWGIQDDRWLSSNSAITSPGKMMPISCVEIRANSNLSEGC